MVKINQRLALQIAVGLTALAPLILGLSGVLQGPNMLVKDYKYPYQVDSHFRYLCGFQMSCFAFLLRNIPTIDRDGTDLRRVCWLVVIGGLARIYGFLTVGVEASAVLANLTELIPLPLLCLWQYYVQKNTVHAHQK
jgi:hypothetical protein